MGIHDRQLPYAQTPVNVVWGEGVLVSDGRKVRGVVIVTDTSTARQVTMWRKEDLQEHCEQILAWLAENPATEVIETVPADALGDLRRPPAPN